MRFFGAVEVAAAIDGLRDGRPLTDNELECLADLLEEILDSWHDEHRPGGRWSYFDVYKAVGLR